MVPFWPAEVFIQRHISAFSSLDMQPKIITSKINHSLYSSSVQYTNQKAYELPRFNDQNYLQKIVSTRSLWSDLSLFFYKRSWHDKILLKFFMKEKPDLIHFHWANLATNLAWVPLELNIPFTFSMRGYDVREMIFNSKYAKNLSEVIKSSSGIHSVSNNIWNQAIALCNIEESSIFHKTIYTTVPIDKFKDNRKAKKSGYIFITTGRLDWTKNYVSLLIAFKKILDEGFDSRLVIVGDGEFKKCLSYWTRFLNIGAHVTFTGTLPYNEIKALFENSDAFIQSSITEGFSNSLAEAMAQGLPVFATNVGGTKEIIRDSENGYLLDPEHPENWWEKLILVRDFQKMQAIRTQAWKDASEKFNAKIHAAQFKQFYIKSMGMKI